MGPDRNKHIRNGAILILLAVAVWQLPGGGEGADTVQNLLAIIFWGGLVFLVYRLYMENRSTIFGLDDRVRALLYGSLALGTITIVASKRLWDEGGIGALAWFALIGVAVYGLYFVWRAHREY